MTGSSLPLDGTATAERLMAFLVILGPPTGATSDQLLCFCASAGTAAVASATGPAGAGGKSETLGR
jgi:hypothetical protein